MSNEVANGSKKNIVVASIASALVAVVILYVAVLPAEYGMDPLGTGEALGLIGLSDSNEVSALQKQAGQWQQDSIEFQLAPFEALEYKYHLQEGGALIFSWAAEGDVLFDLHSEADDHAVAEISFSQDRLTEDSGALRAPFTGIHGWYFQNRSTGDITIRLSAAGFFSHSLEMTDGPTQRYDFK